MRLREIEIIFTQPISKEKMAIIKADITFVVEHITHFCKGPVPTDILGLNGKPKEKAGTHFFIGQNRFLTDMKIEDFKKIFK